MTTDLSPGSPQKASLMVISLDLGRLRSKWPSACIPYTRYSYLDYLSLEFKTSFSLNVRQIFSNVGVILLI